MNSVIQQLMSHRSIRKFKDDPIPEETLHTIIAAGQMASTSSNVQAYSVIAIDDLKQRELIMKLSGNQSFIMESPVFIIWCADLYRLNIAARQHGNRNVETLYTDSTENMIVATVDTALAAQNAAIAAESLGLGIVYIGGVRNNIEQLATILKLPELVYPLFGMCIGVPDQSPMVRPRLQTDTVLHSNTYHEEQAKTGIAQYDETYTAYMLERSNGKSNTPWSAQMHKRLTEPIRLHIKRFLESKGFMKQ